MRIVLIPIQGYKGFEDFTSDTTQRYTRAVTSAIQQTFERMHLSEEVVVSPYAITCSTQEKTNTQEKTRVFEWCKWDPERKDDLTVFKEQCKKAHFIFISGGRSVDPPAEERSYCVRAPEFLTGARPTGEFIDDAMGQLLERTEVPCVVVDPVVSSDYLWVFLDPFGESDQQSIRERMYTTEEVTKGELAKEMNQGNKRAMEAAVKILNSPTQVDPRSSVGSPRHFYDGINSFLVKEQVPTLVSSDDDEDGSAGTSFVNTQTPGSETPSTRAHSQAPEALPVTDPLKGLVLPLALQARVPSASLSTGASDRLKEGRPPSAAIRAWSPKEGDDGTDTARQQPKKVPPSWCC